jgi:hypothetical protein
VCHGTLVAATVVITIVATIVVVATIAIVVTIIVVITTIVTTFVVPFFPCIPSFRAFLFPSLAFLSCFPSSVQVLLFATVVGQLPTESADFFMGHIPTIPTSSAADILGIFLDWVVSCRVVSCRVVLCHDMSCRVLA